MAVDKKKIMAAAFAELARTMPDDTVGQYHDIGKDLDIETLSTGSIAVDEILGGGFAVGRLSCLVGHTSSGKTTLALTAIANMQKVNPDANILFVDAEQALDPAYAASLGVDIDSLYIHQPSSGEAAVNSIITAMNTGVCDLIVVDSIAGMLPKSIIFGDIDSEARPGEFARFISRAIGKIYGLANQSKTTVILINQWKPATKMSTFAAGTGTAGTSWYMPGGQQLPFFLTQLLEIKKSSQVLENKVVVSNVITATVKKNKIAPPYRTADFFITFGKGVDKNQELIGLGLKYGVLRAAGAFISSDIEEIKTVQGRVKLSRILEENPKVAEQLEVILKKLVAEEIAKGKGGAGSLTVDSTAFDDVPGQEESSSLPEGFNPEEELKHLVAEPL